MSRVANLEVSAGTCGTQVAAPFQVHVASLQQLDICGRFALTSLLAFQGTLSTRPSGVLSRTALVGAVPRVAGIEMIRRQVRMLRS